MQVVNLLMVILGINHANRGGIHKHSLVDINELTFPVCLQSSVVLSVALRFMSTYTTFSSSTGGAAAGRLPE